MAMMRNFTLPLVIKRTVAIALAVALAITATAFLSQPAMARYASIVVNEDTGEVMYSSNANTPLYPASLTKIMTLYMVFEALDAGVMTMDTRMRVSRTAASRSPSRLGVRTGGFLEVGDAVMAMIIKSANDAATVVAEHLAGSEREFALRMTDKAHALGMTRTIFRNASGLPHSKQKTTASDMARLGIAIHRDFPHYFHLFKRNEFSWNGKTFSTHNTLLDDYPGVDGIKTGYINVSRFNVVTTVERHGIRLVGVLFGERNEDARDAYMIKVLDEQFASIPSYVEATFASVLAESKTGIASVLPPRVRPDRGDRQNPNARGNKGGGVQLIAQPPPPLPKEARGDQNAPIKVAFVSWQIQLGRYERRAVAHLAARDARQAAQTILATQPAKLREIQYGERTLWQVHFDGFDEAGARETCIALFAEGVPCVAVPEGDGYGLDGIVPTLPRASDPNKPEIAQPATNQPSPSG